MLAGQTAFRGDRPRWIGVERFVSRRDVLLQAGIDNAIAGDQST